MQDVSSLKVATLGGAVVGEEYLGPGPQDRSNLPRCPGVEATLLALGVGV